MSTPRIVDTDIARIRRQLESLDHWRLTESLSSAQQARYEALCLQEENLLAWS
jgi:hypothetical protein